jgi:hypothetical protein
VSTDAGAAGQVAVPKAAFAFCRYAMAAALWLAFFLRIKALVAAVFALLVLSAALTVERAPLLWLYARTLHRLAPTDDEWLDRAGMRVAHSLGACFAGLCLVFLYFVDEKIGWGLTLAYCLVKSMSAVWSCPAYRLYACMKGGNCCAFLKRTS